MRYASCEGSGVPKSMRRLAIVTHGFHPKVGGLERYVLFGARSLGLDFQILVFTPRDPSREPDTAPTANIPANIRVIYLPSLRIRGEQVIIPSLLFSELRKYRPELIWTHQPGGSADFAGVYALLAGIPWIATYHADPLERGLSNRLFLAVEGLMLSRAGRILTTSEEYSSRLAARGIQKSRIFAVPTGPYIGDGFPPEPTKSEVDSSTLPGPDHPFLFVGGLDSGHRYKRPDRLIRAIRRLRDRGLPVNLEFIGGGSRRTELEMLSRSLGVEKLIRFRGAVSDEDLAKAFRLAWALVLPSDTSTEGYSTVCIDAIQYGCPIVGSSVVAAVRALRDFKAAMVFDLTDPEGLENSMATLWKSPSDRAKLSANASMAARQFDWGTYGPMIRNVVVGTIGARP